MGFSIAFITSRTDITADALRLLVLAQGGTSDSIPTMSHLLNKFGYITVFLENEFIPVLEADLPQDLKKITQALGAAPKTVVTIDINNGNNVYALGLSFALKCMKMWQPGIIYLSDDHPQILTMKDLEKLLEENGGDILDL